MISPRVTVLTAVYNGERYLREAIESILSQSFEDFEFLVINDGSSDGTREIIRSYDDPRFVLVDNESNLGLTRSLNLGLGMARGEYVARQDADDVSETHRLARQTACLDQHPEIGALGTGFTKIDADGRSLGVRQPPPDPVEVRWRLLFHNPLVHSTVMLRRSILADIGFFDESLIYAQDYELWCRIARKVPFTNVDEALVRFRINPLSMTETYGQVVDDDQRAISLAYTHDVVRSAGGKVEEFDDRFVAGAFSLLYRPQLALLSDEAVRTAVSALWLHSAFCRYYGIPADKCRSDRRSIRARLIRRLLGMARRQLRKGEFGSARELVVGVGRLAVARKL